MGPKPKYIVAMGASAGGVTALSQSLSQMRKDTPAAFFVTLHIPPHSRPVLPTLLAKASGLPACRARNNQPIEAGHVFVAPSDVHMLIEDGRIRLENGPRENRHRPAIDPMFRSAAQAYHSRVIGVVLTGLLDDGAAGLAEIKREGGLCIVQDPDGAMYPDMPRNAILEASPHLCLTTAEIRELLVALKDLDARGEFKKLLRERCRKIVKPVILTRKPKSTRWKELEEKLGRPTGLICPECGGPLWESKPELPQQYRCLVGHVLSPQSLLAAQGDALEHALWAALRALEERAELQYRLAEKAKAAQNKIAARTFADRAKETDHQAALLREILAQRRS